MKSLICGSVTLLYLLSIVSLQDRWNEIYQWITIRLDLSPTQIPLIPITFNLIAIGFGIPAVVLLTKKKSKEQWMTKKTGMAVLCTIGVGLLMLAVFRWILYRPQSIFSGIPEFFRSSQEYAEKESTIVQGSYDNHKFGLSFDFPDDWHILSPNAIKRAHESGIRQLIEINDVDPAPVLPDGINQFFALRKFPEDHEEHNPTLTIVSYEKNVMRQNDVSNLDELMRSFENYAAHDGDTTPQATPMGNFEGLHIHYSLQLVNETVEYDIYGFETDTHYFTITIVGQNGVDRHAMKKVIRSIRKK